MTYHTDTKYDNCQAAVLVLRYGFAYPYLCRGTDMRSL